MNLFFVFCITGLWHGANWTFVLWGIWHGLFIVAERACGLANMPNSRWDILRHAYTILAFVVGWTMFRADTVTEGIGMIGTMFGLCTPEMLPQGLEYYLSEHNLLILCVALFLSMPVKLSAWQNCQKRWLGVTAYRVGLLLVLILSIANLAASTYNPFIYFRF